MKPWKSLSGIAIWIMRLSMALFIYTRFFGIFMQFNLQDRSFYIAGAYLISGVLLLVGGFSKQSLTVIAGLALVVLTAIQIFLQFNGITPSLALWLLSGSVGLYFLTNGNK
jgi:hypothetical protein